MADNNQPTEKPNKIEENKILNQDGSPITAEQRHDSDNRFDVKTDDTHTIAHNNEPAKPDTIAGSDQFGLEAVSNNDQNRRIQELNLARLDTPQFASDTQNFEDNPYGNDQKASLKQFNGAESGSLSSGMVAGTMQSEIRRDQLADLDRKREEEKNRAAFYVLTELQRQIAEINSELDKLGDEVGDIREKVNQSTNLANEQIDILDDKITELRNARNNVKNEIDELKQDLARTDLSDFEREEKRRMLELKEAQLDNLNHSINFSTYSRDNLHKHLVEANQELENAEKHINDIKAQIQNAGDDPAKVEELKKQLAIAEEQKNVARAKANELTKQVEVTAQALDAVKAASATKTAADVSCLSPDGFKAEVNKIKANTSVLIAMETAVKNDHVIDVSETRDIMQKAKAAGISKEELGALTINAVNAGVIVDETGARVSAANASSFFDEQWASLEGELKQDLAQTNTQLDQKTNEASAILNEIAQDRKTIAQTTALIAEKTTTGSLESQAAAKIGAAVIGENMSIRTDVIRDTAGNAVYADRSGAETTYYYMDKDSGQRIDYKADDLQILNFKMGKDGSAPLRSEITTNSSPLSSKPSNFLDKLSPTTSSASAQPVKIFANDKVDGETYQAKFDQKDAQQSLQENEQKFASVSSEISSLQEKGMLLKSDLEALRKIADEQKAGTISTDEALTQLTELKNNAQSRSLAASSTNTTAGAETRSASETLELSTPKYTLAQAEEMKNKIEHVTSITPEGIERLKEEAAEYGISEETVEDTLAANEVKIEENTYTDSTPQQSPAPTRSVNFAPIGVTTQTPIIASYTPQTPTNGITAKGVTFGSVLDEFPQYNDPKNPDASYLAPVNNKADAAPVASNAFDNALNVQDPAVVAQEAERKRIEQEAVLRQAQELLAARAGIGMMGGAGTSSGA